MKIRDAAVVVIEKYINALGKHLLTKSEQEFQSFISEFTPLLASLQLVKDNIGDTTGMTFLDLGCGTGNVLFTAQQMFEGSMTYKGIEQDEYIAEIARGISPDFDIIEDDLMSEESTKIISEADVVYIFEPIPDKDKQNELYKRINDNLKEGAFLLCNDAPQPDFKKFKKLGNYQGGIIFPPSVITIYKNGEQK